MDICVLEWCKLFGDQRGKHYWRKVISRPDEFFQKLLSESGVSESELNEHIQEMQAYRDKFVAHLDSEEVMHIPDLTITLKSVSYLYDYLLTNEGEPEFYIDATRPALVFYKRFLGDARNEYKGCLKPHLSN